MSQSSLSTHRFIHSFLIHLAHSIFYYVSILVLAGSVTTEVFGEFNYFMTILSFGMIVIQFGTNTSGLVILRDHENVLKDLFGFRCITGVIVLVLLGLFFGIRGGPEYFIFILLSLFGVVLSQQFVLEYKSNLKRELLLKLITNLPWGSYVILEQLGGGNVSLDRVFLLILAGYLMYYIGQMISLRRLPQINFSRKNLNLVFSMSLPIAVLVGLQFLFNYIDIFMIDHFEGKASVGLYSMAYTFFSGLTILFTSFYNRFYVSEEFSQGFNFEKIHQIVRRLFFISLPIVGIFWIGLPPLLNAVYGDKFEASVIVLKWLLVAFQTYGPFTLYSTVLLFMGYRWQVVLILALAVVLNVIFNMYFIPRYSVEGAAIATFASGILVSILSWRKMVKVSPFHN